MGMVWEGLSLVRILWGGAELGGCGLGGDDLGRDDLGRCGLGGDDVGGDDLGRVINSLYCRGDLHTLVFCSH